MPILKCKMCGGEIMFSPNDVVGICDSCGSQTTLPKISEDRLASLFDRANYFRMKGDFDKAESSYERILEEDNSLAEAHWGAALSRYGIEYVEDPDTHKRIPTCHRANWKSILSDDDYKATLQYAEEDARQIYESEAKYIDEVQKRILTLSKAEEPYDIFICYKESTDGGNRTKDSVLAQNLYDRLTKEGFRVFFSRITLEDKLGQQYEPYIFSALNSAKVMLVVGTDVDNFNATWVKNEWGRFIALIKEQSDKVLIPCFKGIDAYELPEELSIFQSQDMGKVGFEQDLIRGIKKIIGKQMPVSNTAALEQSRANADALVRRGRLFLEDSDWKSAEQYFDRALDAFPECSDAYIGKLCVELGCQKEGQIVSKVCNRLQKDVDNLDNDLPFESLAYRKNYMNAVRFADEQTRSRLENYKNVIENAIRETSWKKCEKYSVAIQEIQEQIDALDEKSRHYEDEIQRYSDTLDGVQKDVALSQTEIEGKKKRLSEGKQKEQTLSKAPKSKKGIGIAVGFISYIVSCWILYFVGENTVFLAFLIAIVSGVIVAKVAARPKLLEFDSVVRENKDLANGIEADLQAVHNLRYKRIPSLQNERSSLISKKEDVSRRRSEYLNRIDKYQLSQQKYMQNGKNAD